MASRFECLRIMGCWGEDTYCQSVETFAVAVTVEVSVLRWVMVVDSVMLHS
jgi:hypothetical protein